MDLRALMQQLETINTTQTLTESVEERVIITESVATSNPRIEELTFKSSIARGLAKEFGYELNEEGRGGGEAQSDADYFKQQAQGQKNLNSVKRGFGGGSSVDLGNTSSWDQLGTTNANFANTAGITPTTAPASGITMKDVQDAVGQEKDEQKRAAILSDLAGKQKLPGLYDPVSGYFVRNQPAPSGDNGQNNYSISATAREADTQALAKMGLVPGNAKTSALGGVVGTGKNSWGGLDKAQSAANDKASTDVKQQSANVQGGQRSNTFYAPKIAKLKELIAKISGTAESIIFNSATARSLVESFSYRLNEKVTLGTGPGVTNPATGVTAGKFQAEVAEINKIIGELGNADELPPEVSQVVQSAQAAVTKLATPAAAPSPAAPAAAAPAAAAPAAPNPAVDTLKKNAGLPAAPTGVQAQGDDDGNTTITRPDGTTMVVGPDGNAIKPGSNPNLAANKAQAAQAAAPAPAQAAALGTDGKPANGMNEKEPGWDTKTNTATPAAFTDPRAAEFDRVSKLSGKMEPAPPAAGAEEKKIARFKELLDKAKAGSVTPPAETKESIGYFLNKLRFIESCQLNEALTPEEQTEMDGLAAELGGPGSKNNPAITALINSYNSSKVTPGAPAAAAASAPAAAGRPADAAAMANANYAYVTTGSDEDIAIQNGYGPGGPAEMAKWRAAGSPGKPKPADSAPPAGSLTGEDPVSASQWATLNTQMAKPEAPAKATPGADGAVGQDLAKMGVTKQNRLDQAFVDKTLGAGKYTAGSADSNLALQTHFKKRAGYQQDAQPQAAPTRDAFAMPQKIAPGIGIAAGNKPQGTPGQRPAMYKDPRIVSDDPPVAAPAPAASAPKPAASPPPSRATGIVNRRTPAPPTRAESIVTQDDAILSMIRNIRVS